MSRGIAAPVRRVMTRRRELLSGSNCAGGALAWARSAVDPQLALCGATSNYNIVERGDATTANTTNIAAGSTLSNNREPLVDNGGTIAPAASSGRAIDIGATVAGFGLAISNTSTSDITVVNNGTVVTLTCGRSHAGGLHGAGEPPTRSSVACCRRQRLRAGIPLWHASTVAHENTLTYENTITHKNPYRTPIPLHTHIP
jgi:hypothetical protein